MNDNLENFIRNHLHRNNQKQWFQYYISKELYELFDYAIIYHSFEVEFFTINEDYKRIWELLSYNHNYGRCVLKEIGYDETYDCYIVHVVCGELLNYIRSFRQSSFAVMGERQWKNHALKLGWTEDEVENGYDEYHRFVWGY